MAVAMHRMPIHGKQAELDVVGFGDGPPRPVRELLADGEILQEPTGTRVVDIDIHPRTSPAMMRRARSSTGLSIMEPAAATVPTASSRRSEEHTSELQSLMRISYAVFCLKKK